MKLESLSIKNFRSFEDATIDFVNYTSLVGPNGSGKSTVLMALNVLFKHRANVATDTQTLTEEDFHNKKTSEPIVIEAVFADLSAGAEEDLKHYVRQGKLIIKAKAKWNAESKVAEVKHYGARLGMEVFKEFFEKHKEGAKVDILKKIYEDLQKKCPELPKATSRDAKRDTLREYEDSHPDLCVLLDSEDQFFGIQGTGKIAPYLQWVYIPAVKDASSEQEEAKNTALGQLLERTIRAKVNFSDYIDPLEDELKEKYKQVLENHAHVLLDVSTALESKLRMWANPDARVKLSWNFDDQKSVKVMPPTAKADISEKHFLGDIRRMGHGLQRAFIVSVLQVLATASQETAPTLLLGFEEPELYQHPPQARYLAELLKDMENTQVIATTHSPYFVSGKGVENIRLVRYNEERDQSSVAYTTLSRLGKRIGKALGEEPQIPSYVMASVQQIMNPSLNELYFSRLAVLVEGPEDVAFISTHLELSGLMKEFRKVGAHLIACDGKTSMSRPLAIACELGIPFFVIFDSDPEQKTAHDTKRNIADNRCLLSLCGCGDVDPSSPTGHVANNMVMWKNAIKKEVVDDIGQEQWNKAWEKMKKQYGGISGKNEMLISSTLEHLYSANVSSEALNGLCKKIIACGS